MSPFLPDLIRLIPQGNYNPDAIDPLLSQIGEEESHVYASNSNPNSLQPSLKETVVRRQKEMECRCRVRYLQVYFEGHVNVLLMSGRLSAMRPSWLCR